MAKITNLLCMILKGIYEVWALLDWDDGVQNVVSSEESLQNLAATDGIHIKMDQHQNSL